MTYPLRLLFVCSALLCTISASITQTVDGNRANASVSSPSPSPSPTLLPVPVPPPESQLRPSPVASTPTPSPQLVVKLKTLWGYRYKADELPDLTWLKLDPSIPYQLVDINGICVGRSFAGRNYLRHHSPSVCTETPTGGQNNAI